MGSAFDETVHGRQCAIVVVHYGERAMLDECIAKLAGNGVAPSVIYVVDNTPEPAEPGPPAGGVAYQRQLENSGFAGGANAGLRRALAEGHEFALLLNPDAEVHADGVEALVRCMREHADVAICGPVIAEGDPSHRYAGARIDWRSGRVEDLPTPEATAAIVDVDYVPGCGMLLRLSALETFGNFDERFFLYWEDADLCTRARQSGWRVVVCEGAQIQHARSRSTGRDTGLVPYYMTRNALYFFQKHLQPPFVRLTVVVRLVMRNLAIGLWCVLGGKAAEGWGRLGGVVDYCHGRRGRTPRYRHALGGEEEEEISKGIV